MVKNCGRQTTSGTCTHPKSRFFLRDCPGVSEKADVRECDFVELMPEINTKAVSKADRCRKLFINCDGILSCIAPMADDITEDKCLKGIGECEFKSPA